MTQVILKGVIDELKGNERVEEVLKSVGKDTQRKWIERFSKEFIERECESALEWIENQPGYCKPPSVGAFLAMWFNRRERGLIQ